MPSPLRGVQLAYGTLLPAAALVSLVACHGDTPPLASRAGSAVPATYVGQQTCAGCHEREARSWRASHHAVAMQPASADTVLGDFNSASFVHGGQLSTFFSSARGYRVRTEGPDGKPQDFEVAYTFGAVPLQQYLVRFVRGRYQALGVAWDSRSKEEGGQRWFHLYPNETIRARDALHWTAPAQNWNFMCAECHSTDLRKNFSAANDQYDSTWAEVNVSCEACHGAGSRHVEWAQAPPGQAKGGDSKKGLAAILKDRALWTMSPGSRIAVRSPGSTSLTELETCARCHSRRSQLWPDYEQGLPIEQTHRVALLDEGLYFPDGQLLDEVFEYGSFLQSRMHAAGVTCSNCHDPHSGTLRESGNAVCTQCHARTAYDTPSHHFHPAGGEATKCVSCHMAERLYLVIDGRRDHSFRVPRPDESVRFATPNACTDCHAREGAQWAAGAVARWFGPAAQRRPTFTAALVAARARRPEAREKLASVAGNPTFPGIARATAVALLARFAGDRIVDDTVAQATRDGDSLVRRAAATALGSLDSATRLRIGTALLNDPVRSVRVEAVLPMTAAPPGSLGVEHERALAAAVAEFRRVQDLNADQAEAYVNLGTLEAQLGQPDAATRAFEKAIRMRPEFAPAYVALAELHRSVGRDAEAERVLRLGVTHAPAAADLRHTLGLVFVRQKQLRAALVELGRAMELAPAEPRYAYVYAIALYDAGERPRALQVLEQAAARHPAYREIIEALVSYALQAGDRARARNWAERLRGLAPGDAHVAELLQTLKERSR